jgi:hypothetical protein
LSILAIQSGRSPRFNQRSISLCIFLSAARCLVDK